MYSDDFRPANVAVRFSPFRFPAFRQIANAVILCLVVACLISPQNTLAQTSPPPLPVDPLPGQPKIATVTFGPAKVVSPRRHRAVFEKVGLQPQQTVAVALRYPPNLAGHIVAIEPLDGGRVVTPAQSLIIGADGALAFQYQAGASPGLYQVTVHYDTQLIAFQFWVFDNAHLENGPVVLTAP